MQSHVWAFGVVVVEVLREHALPGGQGTCDAGKTLVLNRPVETFKVSIVGRRPDAGVPVGNRARLELHREPFGEFLAVVRLEGLKRERRLLSGGLNELQAPVRGNPFGHLGKGPARADIKECVNVQPVIVLAIVDRIDFHECTWLCWLGTWNVLVPFLPLGVVRQLVPLERAFHRREAHPVPISSKHALQELGAATVPSAVQEDSVYQRTRELPWVVVRAAGARGNDLCAAILGCTVHPLHDRSLGESQVPCCCPGSPPSTNQTNSVHTDAREVWVGCVHTHRLPGDSKLLNHYRGVDNSPNPCYL